VREQSLTLRVRKRRLGAHRCEELGSHIVCSVLIACFSTY
jgi:hypothetical protein